MFKRVAAAVVIAVGGLGFSLWGLASPGQTAVGGPVILGGDDLTDHGYVSGGDLFEGWLYIQRALENIGPAVTRSNDGSIAALGSAASDVTSGDAGAAIGFAGAKVGRSVTYYEGAAAIDSFFTSLAGGGTHPAIIWIAGTGASNDLDTDERAALTPHASAIAGFVSSGGGLMSHGTYYDWLTALLPDASAVGSGGSGDLYFTADGLTDLPSLTGSDINAGPWHNHFEGDLGGLKVLVRSTGVVDSQENDAAVIIGGAQVTFEPVTPPAEPPAATPCIGGIVTSRCPRNVPDVNVTPTATVAVPTAAPITPTVAAPAPSPAPGGGAAGAISAPDTGTGPGPSGGQASIMWMSAALAAGGLMLSGTALRFRKR